MLEPQVEQKLNTLYNRAPVHSLSSSDRVVIVSDLHMGDGGFNDDFHRTSSLFKNVFENYYLEKGFNLILNGDVEELHKFILDRIVNRWNSIYDLFKRFQEELSLFKIHGNHDSWMNFLGDHGIIHKQMDSLRLQFSDADIFLLHGHQASPWLEGLHHLHKTLLRRVVKPMQLKNFTLDLGKKGVTKKESRMSEYSVKNKILTIVGHTHRPLFGTYSGSPLVYNSGAAIGNKGITTLEIDRGRLNLVHWWGRKLVKRYLDPSYDPERLGREDTYRIVLNSRPLTSIFGANSVPY